MNALANIDTRHCPASKASMRQPNWRWRTAKAWMSARVGPIRVACVLCPQAGDDELMKRAVRIRDRAIRRCGELPSSSMIVGGLRKLVRATIPFPNARQRGTGWPSKHQQVTAVRVANVPHDDFEAMVESDTPPTVTKLGEHRQGEPSDHRPRRPRPDRLQPAMHFWGMLQDYSRELAGWNPGIDVLLRLIELERAAVRQLIGQIDAVHDTIMTRI